MSQHQDTQKSNLSLIKNEVEQRINVSFSSLKTFYSVEGYPPEQTDLVLKRLHRLMIWKVILRYVFVLVVFALLCFSQQEELLQFFREYAPYIFKLPP